MNKYISPEYGEKLLSNLFKDIEVRDYSKIKNCEHKYPDWGITVMAYSDYKDVYARIHYLPSNEIVFNIEVDQETCMNSRWKNDDVNDSVYEYFLFIMNKILKDIEETSQHIDKFKSKYWIERQKKIDTII